MKIGNWLKENYWLVVILCVAAGLRIYKLDFQSLWLDEVLTMNDTNPKLNFKQFYDSVLFWEAFPHLYFLLLKYFLLIFGYTSNAARMFSAIIGIFGVYAIYLLAKELFSKRVGYIAAAITAVNIFHISHSQEVRPYGMLFLFTVLAFYRLVILIRNPTYKNAIYYGIFAGLIINSHFFGVITVFAQFLILLFFLIKTPADSRVRFFTCSFISGIVTGILVLPTYEALKQVSEIKAFWIPKPAPDAFSAMFSEFFGQSELVLFLINIIIIHYLLRLFRQRLPQSTRSAILSNNLVFSFIILAVWFMVSLVIPILKSYLDVSIILIRYFINVLPVLLLAIAIGIELIKSRFMKYTVLGSFLILSILNLLVVKNYYNTVTKSQYRELTNAIKEKSKGETKVIVYWGWIFPYFFSDTPNIKVEQYSLEDYINGMRNNTIPKKTFWYADANVRPYALKPEDQAYLEQNFDIGQKLELFDAWANYYVSKTELQSGSEMSVALNENIDLRTFKHADFDDKGNMLLFSQGNVLTPFFAVKKGSYNLLIKGSSLPVKPIKNENAHLKVKINEKEIGSFFLSEDPSGKEEVLPFEVDNDKKIRVQIIFDNDFQENGQDRNVIIYSVSVKKNN